MSAAQEVKSELRYTRDHEWAKPTEGELIVGITPFAVEQLGDITMVNFDVEAGDSVEAGAVFGTVESVKTVSDLFAPVAGRVLRINPELDAKPELLNEDCWGAGWLLALEVEEGAVDDASLLDADQYRAHLASASD